MIICESCQTPIDHSKVNTGEFLPCSSCDMAIRTDMFPAAIRRTDDDKHAQSKMMEDDAGCFFHPSKKAVITCSSCGRFLCSLCDVEMDGYHICFSCMESGHNKQEITTHETYRVLYDSMALKLSLLPIVTVIFLWFSFITAPIALFIALKHWKKEKSIAPRGRYWRSVLAVILSTAQILGWAGILFYTLNS